VTQPKTKKTEMNPSTGVTFRVMFSNGNGSVYSSQSTGDLPPHMGLLQQLFNFNPQDQDLGQGAANFPPSMFIPGFPFGGFPLNTTGDPATQNPTFQDFLNRTFQMYQQQHAGPPPTSVNVLNSLKERLITDEEISKQEECPVCQDKFKTGEGIKGICLPCKHLYHTECVMPWLKEHNTCPVCRWELPTDDAAYEQQRKKKMSQREGYIPEQEVPREVNSDVMEEDEVLKEAIRLSLEEQEKEERQKLREEQDREFQESLAQDRAKEAAEATRNVNNWACRLCTYSNPPLNLVCEICGADKPSLENVVNPSEPVASENKNRRDLDMMEIDQEEKKDINEEDVRPLRVEDLRAKRLAALEKQRNPSPANTTSSNISKSDSEDNRSVNRVEEVEERTNINNQESSNSSNNSSSWWSRLKDTIWGEEEVD